MQGQLSSYQNSNFRLSLRVAKKVNQSRGDVLK